MSSKRGLVLADDATGALECASALSAFDVSLALREDAATAANILVVDTETRHLPPEMAARRITQWAVTTTGAIFKKTDSTLRGNIAAELLALLPRGPLVYVPAYPSLGRIVVEGRLFVHGALVHQTDFARDPRHPVRSSLIADLFPPELVVAIRNATELTAFLLRKQSKIAICDAASDENLHELESALRGHAVTLAGPGGFVKAWAALGAYLQKTPEPLPKVGDWLIVCGSRHPQSRRQVNLAAPPVLMSPEEDQAPEAAATDLARQAAAWIARHQPQGVLIMGGDTAWALWRELGIAQLQPLPEVLPGVAACRSGKLVFVTKAGGFGDDDLVAKVKERFA